MSRQYTGGAGDTCCVAAAVFIRSKPGCTYPGTPVNATVATPKRAATRTAVITLHSTALSARA